MQDYNKIRFQESPWYVQLFSNSQEDVPYNAKLQHSLLNLTVRQVWQGNRSFRREHFDKSGAEHLLPNMQSN